MTLTAESTSKYVVANGVRVHLHEAGPLDRAGGPLLLLIHGGAPGAYGWGNFGQNMDAFAASYRTVIVDLPGYGRSDKPVIDRSEQYSFHARVFAALIHELGEERAHVVGMATGGAVAMALAINHPEVVDRLALVSTAGGLPMFSVMPSEGQKVIQGYYGGEGPSRAKMQAYLEMMFFDKSLITDEIVDERYEASVQPDFMEKAPEGRGEPAGPPEQLWDKVQRIKARTLVVWGRDNRVQGYDNAIFLLNRIPDASMHVFGRTGLWVPYERKAQFEALIDAFLSGE